MVGLVDMLAHITRAPFQDEHDTIVLLGEPTAELGASEYVARVHGLVAGAPPACDPEAERRLIDGLLEAIRAGVVRSAHDCADGGLAVALAECCIMDREAPHGATIDLTHWRELPARALLFGEAQARVIVSTVMPDTLLGIARSHGVPARVIGQVGAVGAPMQITTVAGPLVATLERLDEAYHEAIPRLMARASAVSAS
jgi:phosphoribosylformylglycinamidine synthase